ncbi:replication-relaxation family protein [Micromonospora sp. Llam7]|uniref:replication-relaxation family protein n=1 Tax=Micromonospora tarapacensis TaxID=2835305 RepID=UPI001C82F4D4|nr:replication-relaxation family protein [Micromonospora tarapacensis]MBX7268824.1 replication-relaxation family protein [Micromonospora tarapacensis]
MTPRASRPTPAFGRRARSGLVVALAEQLTEREWNVMETVNRLRLVTGLQLERLHFAELTGKSRSVVRWRVLKRLVDWRVLLPLPRRIGGGLHGSGQLAYALDTAGERLLRLRRNLRHDEERIRRPGEPGQRFVQHTLAVSELYVSLVERSRVDGFTVGEFLAEPAAWWPNGSGGWMKPDAYVALANADVTDHWWIEVDLATEAVPTLRGKFLAYTDFAHRGQLGPDGVLPRVLVTVPNGYRLDVMCGLLPKLPEPADELLTITLHETAPAALVNVLYAPDEG